MARISVEPPGGEPFFDELQRLQPDIDVIVLPPAAPRPAGSARPPASPEETESAVDRVVATTEELLLGADLRPTVRSARWERTDGEERQYVVRVSVRDLEAGTAIHGLRRLRDLVLARGWDARPVESPLPRMTATAPDRSATLAAGCTDTTVDVAVRSPRLVPTPGIPGPDGSTR